LEIGGLESLQKVPAEVSLNSWVDIVALGKNALTGVEQGGQGWPGCSEEAFKKGKQVGLKEEVIRKTLLLKKKKGAVLFKEGQEAAR
jgi:hypothetical protein